MPGPIEAAGGTKEPTEYATLSMDSQFTGIWSQRNPLRDADVPYLYRKFYSASRFDSIIDGINREITSRLTDRRRPGSISYNTNTFPAGNSFYSYKSIQNGTEVIRVLYDGKNGNIYDATADQQTLLFTKSPGAGRARFLGINNELFFGDGVDQQKMMQPGPWHATSGGFVGDITNIQVRTAQMGGVGPEVYFLIVTLSAAAPTLIPNQPCAFAGLTTYTALNGETLNWQSISLTYNLDLTADQIAFYYGTATYGPAADTGTVTGSSADSINPGTLIQAVPSGHVAQYIYMALGGITMQIVGTKVVGTLLYVYFDQTNLPDQFANLVGAHLTFSELVTETWLNGQTLTVNSIVSSTLGILTCSTTETPYAYTAETAGQATTGTGFTGSSAPAFNATVGSITVDSGQQWKNYGPAIQNWMPAAPTVAPVLTPLNGTRFWQPKTSVGEWYAILDTNQNIEVALAAGVTGRSYPVWAAQPAKTLAYTTDGSITWYNYGQVGSWSPDTQYAEGTPATATFVILDSNKNLQLVTNGAGGDSGGTQPTWATTVGATTADGALTWTCLGPGVTLTTETISYAYAWHTIDGSVTTASPTTTIYGGILGPAEPNQDYELYLSLTAQLPTDPQIDQTWIFRTAQGQSTLLYEDAVNPSNLAPDTTVIWNELGIPDVSNGAVPGLDALITAPIDGSGTPPPAGATAPAYHNGRTWVIVGNIVYWSEGADTNFNGNTSWPPLNQAAFPAAAYRLLPVTLSNGGLLVWTSGGVFVILGTGTSTNPYYVTNYEPSVSISSYDALDVLGTTPYFMESNGKVSSLDPQNGYTEVGFPIGDQFQEVTTGGITAVLYNPATTYVSWNLSSSGETAMYVSDGGVGWFRMAPIAPPESGLCWSPRAGIVGGTSAVQSVETSPGIFQLLIAPASSGPILARDNSGETWTDGGITYPAWDSKGVIRLCESGQVAEVAHVAVKCTNVDTPPPIVSILMDETEASSTAFFDALAVTSFDPPNLAPSESMQSVRYQAMQNGETPKGDCMLLKIDFGSQAAGDELLLFSIYGRKWEERVQQQA
jgi:hypothetical protein